MAITHRAQRRFYRSRDWTKVNTEARLLYGECCRNGNDHPGPFEVDHIIPVTEWWGGRLQLTNLQVLCIPCHRQKHSVRAMKKAA